MSLQTWGEVLVSAQGDGTAVTAAARTSLLTAGAAQAKYTLPANYFSSIGKQLVIKASGRLSTVVTTPGTLRFDVGFGANVVFDSQAIGLVVTNAYTNVNWDIEILLTCRAVGATANLFQGGWFTSPNILGSANVAMPIGGVVAGLPWNTAPGVGANFDSTATQLVDFFFTQTVATGSCQLHQYSLISLN